MPEQEHTIYLVDDHESVRRSAGFMLKTSGFSVESYESGDALLKDAGQLEPGCILMDVQMPGRNGLEVQEELKARGIAFPVIVMTGHGDIDVAVRAMKAGAIDFIEKPFKKETLLSAIGEGCHRLDQRRERSARAEEARIRVEALTPREKDVLGGLVKGHPNKTIAYDLGISPRTVEIHRANVMRKLEVQSLSEALRIAFAAGVGDGEE